MILAISGCAGEDGSSDVTPTENVAPVPTSSSFTPIEDTIFSAQLKGFDADGDTLTYSKVSDPTFSAGTITISSTGVLVYTPAANFSGPTSFSYKINDGKVDSVTKNVNLSVTSENDPAVIQTSYANVSLSKNDGTSNYNLSINDVEGDELSITVDSNNTSLISVTQNWSNPLKQASYDGVGLDFNLTIGSTTGKAKISITVNDGDINTTKSFEVTVSSQSTSGTSTGGTTTGGTSTGGTTTGGTSTNGAFTGGVFRNKSYQLVISTVTSRVWLDRNMGADNVCTHQTSDITCRGDYYQWGRKANGHQLYYPTHSILTSRAIKSVGIYENSASFVINQSSNSHDWTVADVNGAQRSEYWASTDGKSPCPVGFRVPTTAEFTAETANPFSGFLKIAASGKRSEIDGRQGNRTEAFFWTSEASAISRQANYFHYQTSDLHGTSNVIRRGEGLSVRCIKD